MVAVQQGKVLVTGANGFVAVWVVQRLLEQGYSVRGTIRSESKTKYVRELFSSMATSSRLSSSQTSQRCVFGLWGNSSFSQVR